MIGSYISNLMCWRDLDVGLLVGPAYGPRYFLHLISRVMELPGVSASSIGANGLTIAQPGLVKGAVSRPVPACPWRRHLVPRPLALAARP